MSCADCIAYTISSLEFFKKLYPDGINPNPLPITASIELTLRCNLRCRHCYILYPGATDGEMNTTEVKQVLKKMADGGVIFLLMTGGELMARPDFREIYLYAKELGFLLTLNTNATLIDDAMCAFLVKYPPRKIEVTMYGHTAKTYEAVSGVKGSFTRYREGVRRLLDAGLRTILKTMVLKTNQHEFAAMRDWVHAQGLGEDFRYDHNLHPRLDGNPDVLQERLTPEEILRIEAHTPQIAEEIREKMAAINGVAEDDELFHCGAGIRTCHVDPRGQLHPCMLWRKGPYDLLQRELAEGWRAHVEELRAQKNPSGKCTSCDHRTFCGRCPAQSLLDRKDPTLPIDYHCQLSTVKARHYARDSSEARQAGDFSLALD